MAANKGFAAAVNHGIAISDSPYVALLNNDAVPEPGWLEAMVDALERDPAPVVRGLAHALHRRARHQRGRRRLRRARPRRLQPRHPRARRPALRRAAHRLRRLRGRRALPAQPVPRHRPLRRAALPLVGGRRPRSARRARRPSLPVRADRGRAPRPGRVVRATGARALERRNKAILALKGLPLPLLALYLTLLPAREAYETRAAREGVRGYLRRLAPYASEAPRALRRRGEVRRRTGVRELWPLLTRDSLPYEPPPHSR